MRKGQLGKFITTIPVMILIFIIIGVYLGLSFGLEKMKGEKMEYEYPTYSENNLLLQEINIVFNVLGSNRIRNDAIVSTSNRKMLVFDAILYLKKGNVEKQKLDESLKNILKNSKDNNCLALRVVSPAFGKSVSIDYFFFGEKKQGNVNVLWNLNRGNEREFQRYVDEILISNLNVYNEDIGELKIYSYYGECLNE